VLTSSSSAEPPSGPASRPSAVPPPRREPPGSGAPDEDFEQDDALNKSNLGVPPDPTLALGPCGNDIVQVPVEDLANGVDVPVRSPGESEAAGQAPEICASNRQLTGGSVQGN
jgi:hypothetical protein